MARNRGGTSKKATDALDRQIGASEFALVPFLDGCGAVELLRRRVFSRRLGRHISHKRNEAVGECATPTEVFVSAGKLLKMHLKTFGAQHVSQRAGAKQDGVSPSRGLAQSNALRLGRCASILGSQGFTLRQPSISSSVQATLWPS
jgi:hypothetical protein